jgi:hypothetical protein
VTLDLRSKVLVTYLALLRWDLFNFLDVSLRVWVPRCSCILCDRSHIGLVGGLLDPSAAAVEIALKESPGGIGFFGSDVYMVVEVQFIVNVKTKIFGRCDLFQIDTMDAVRNGNRLEFLCYSDNLTLGRMEFH